MTDDQSANTTPRRLHLSENKMLAGVCGGIGEYFHIDPTLIRLAWVVGTLLTGLIPGLVGYLIAAIVIPPASTTTTTGKAST